MNLKTIFLLTLSCLLLVIPLSSLATKPSNILQVDCAKGDSIMKALENPAQELTIEISGICVEDVIIERSNVILRGTDPLLDGIQPAPVESLDQALNIFNAHEITVENLSFSGANVGFAINDSTFVTLTNCRFENNASVGFIVGSAGVVNMYDSVITNNSNVGVLISNGGSLGCFNCTVTNQFTGFQVRLGSELILSDSTVQASGRALDARGGARILTLFGTTPNTLVGPRALRLTGTVSAELNGDTMTGKLDLQQNSTVRLNSVSQTASSGDSFITGDSSVEATGGTNLDGDYQIRDFSKVILSPGASSAGSLNCFFGGDAFCAANPFGGGGGTSNCGQCPFP
jgi:hypothetical protein